MRNSSTEKRIRRLRSKYRKRIAIWAVVMLIVGTVLGVVVDRTVLTRRDSATSVIGAPEATATPTVEPTDTPEPTPLATEAPEEEPETWTDPEAEPEGDAEPEPEAEPDTEPEAEPEAESKAAAAPTATPEAETEAEATQTPGTIEIPAADGQDAEPVAKSAPAPADDDVEQESFTIPMDDPEATLVPTATPVPEITATPEPTPSPEPSPAPGPTTLAVVPFGESYTFNAQITPDGRARLKADDGEPFETLTFTLTMKDYMLPSDYSSKWGNKYKLKGTEAGAGFDLTLGDYTGTCTIIPQNILTVVLQSETGDTKNPGFQMTDAEINGKNDVEILPGATKTFWKRYTFSNAGEPMEYLSVSACINGSVQTVLFKLKSDVAPTPDPQTLYTTLTRGDKSDAVIDMQKRLIELGYLSGSADGSYGEMTQTAVRKAQKDFGMEETGTATPEFQVRLFSDPEETPAPEPEAEAAQATEDPEAMPADLDPETPRPDDAT